MGTSVAMHKKPSSKSKIDNLEEIGSEFELLLMLNLHPDAFAFTIKGNENLIINQ